jgi:hypothetical protein
MRELPPADQLLRPRDAEPIVVVPPQTWHCMFCDPQGPLGTRTTVIWLGPNTDGPHGRCTECGQKYALAGLVGMLLREALPPRAVESRLVHCEFCQPVAEVNARPTIAWRGARGRCARCGQAYARVEVHSQAA